MILLGILSTISFAEISALAILAEPKMVLTSYLKEDKTEVITFIFLGADVGVALLGTPSHIISLEVRHTEILQDTTEITGGLVEFHYSLGVPLAPPLFIFGDLGIGSVIADEVYSTNSVGISLWVWGFRASTRYRFLEPYNGVEYSFGFTIPVWAVAGDR